MAAARRPPASLVAHDHADPGLALLRLHVEVGVAGAVGMLDGVRTRFLARDDDAVVVRPMSLGGLRGRLESLGIETQLYPVLAEA